MRGDTLAHGSSPCNLWTRPVQCCAIWFPCYQASSWPQLAILSALQALMLGYLILARPYLEWQLMALEVAAHTCELALFTAAMASMMLPDSFAITLSMMGEWPRRGRLGVPIKLHPGVLPPSLRSGAMFRAACEEAGAWLWSKLPASVAPSARQLGEAWFCRCSAAHFVWERIHVCVCVPLGVFPREKNEEGRRCHTGLPGRGLSLASVPGLL